MKVRYSTLALGELDAILVRISANNPQAAQRLNRQIHSIVERIAQFPESAQQVSERPAIWRVPLVRYSYAIYYRNTAEEIMILRIVHGARRNSWEEL